jgi:hypothetical protein
MIPTTKKQTQQYRARRALILKQITKEEYSDIMWCHMIIDMGVLYRQNHHRGRRSVVRKLESGHVPERKTKFFRGSALPSWMTY